MQIEFVDATREVTRSCHLLHVNEHVVALDCGLFQGHREESRRKKERLPFDAEKLDAIVLSHAHIDHAGRLPLLINGRFRTRFEPPPPHATCVQ